MVQVHWLNVNVGLESSELFVLHNRLLVGWWSRLLNSTVLHISYTFLLTPLRRDTAIAISLFFRQLSEWRLSYSTILLAFSASQLLKNAFTGLTFKCLMRLAEVDMFWLLPCMRDFFGTNRASWLCFFRHLVEPPDQWSHFCCDHHLINFSDWLL